MSSDDVSALGHKTAETRGVLLVPGAQQRFRQQVRLVWGSALSGPLNHRTRGGMEEASARVFRVWQRLHLMDAGFLPTERRVLGESLKLLDDLRASLAERERATEAALAEAERQRDEALQSRNDFRASRWEWKKLAEKLAGERNAAEAERDEARLSSHSFWKLAADMWEKRARAAEAAAEKLRACLVEHHNMATLSDAVLREYDYRQCPVCARAVLAAVPPQQGAPADTDARPANNAGTRGGASPL
jgi:hypothetical protein